MSKVQTDNSYFAEKVRLRLENLPLGNIPAGNIPAGNIPAGNIPAGMAAGDGGAAPARPKVRVLDCFHGEGLLWKEVQRQRPDLDIEVCGIDAKPDRQGLYLVGDNMKYLPAMDLAAFDVIDLDAYGIPFKQIAATLGNPASAGRTVFVTAIQPAFGRLPQGMLEGLGFGRKMVKKCPTLFDKGGITKLLDWLAISGVRKVRLYQDASRRKNYFSFVAPRISLRIK